MNDTPVKTTETASEAFNALLQDAITFAEQTLGLTEEQINEELSNITQARMPTPQDVEIRGAEIKQSGYAIGTKEYFLLKPRMTPQDPAAMPSSISSTPFPVDEETTQGDGGPETEDSI